jgi:hypothetical protein
MRRENNPRHLQMTDKSVILGTLPLCLLPPTPKVRHILAQRVVLLLSLMSTLLPHFLPEQGKAQGLRKGSSVCVYWTDKLFPSGVGNPIKPVKAGRLDLECRLSVLKNQH